jgi:exosome complex component RRP42
MEKYCIIPGQSVWQINIDVMVFESSGNLPDFISIAIYAALNDTIFPSIKVVGVEGEDKNIEVESDPAAGGYMDVSHFPICVTLSKIGNCFITDPMQEEELCMTAQVSVAVDPKGNVCGIQKSGTGAIGMKEMQAMIDEACATSRGLFKKLHDALHLQRTRDISHGKLIERLGFLA